MLTYLGAGVPLSSRQVGTVVYWLFMMFATAVRI